MMKPYRLVFITNKAQGSLCFCAISPGNSKFWSNDSCGSSHVRTDALTKMKSDLSILLHHALHWAVYESSQFMRLWYLSHMQPGKAQTSLHIRSLARGINTHIQGM